LKHEPWRLEKKRFKSMRQKGKTPQLNAINLGKICGLTDRDEINLDDFGYHKVLAAGELKRPMTVKAKAFSKYAIKKIEKAGGKAIIEQHK